jgi:DNA-binding NarL/FixJ family response regulator
VQARDPRKASAVVAVMHGGLSEGIRGLLSTEFASVVMVADESALNACMESLHPRLVVLDLTLVPGGGLGTVARLKQLHPETRLILLGGEADAGLERAARRAGADRYISHRALGTQLMAAVDELMTGPGSTGA